MHKKTTKASAKKSFLNNKKAVLAGIVLLLVGVAGVTFAVIMNNKTKNAPQQTTPETVETPEAPPASQETPTAPTPQNQQPAAKQPRPVNFAVTGVTVHDPTIVYNIDKLGNPHKACQVKADITVSMAGTVKYYWDTYHPEFFNPSNKGPEESVSFTLPSTKSVTLGTYVSDDNRRFTLVIVSPNSLSKATATKVWCQK